MACYVILFSIVYILISVVGESSLPSLASPMFSGYIQIPREKLLLFPSFESVMEIFNEPKYKDLEETKRLLFHFNHKCLGYQVQQQMKGKTRKPFIVIEGNQRTCKKIVARRVARRLGATYLSNPPSCLVKLTTMFPYGSVLRRTYFGLCMYATARHVNWLYNRWPVVLNGYYYDQASFSIAQVHSNTSLPLTGDPLYDWPEDLLKPDIVFHVDFPDNLHREPATTRNPSSWKPRMFEVYKRINDSRIVFLNTRNGLDEAEDFIINTIVDRLSGFLDFTVSARGEVAPLKPKHIRKHRVRSG